jgi:hypothetical protein
MTRTSSEAAEKSKAKKETEKDERDWNELSDEERAEVYQKNEKEKADNRPSGNVEVPMELGNDWGYYSKQGVVRAKYSAEDDAYIVFDEPAFRQEWLDTDEDKRKKLKPEGEWVAPEEFDSTYMVVQPKDQPPLERVAGSADHST